MKQLVQQQIEMEGEAPGYRRIPIGILDIAPLLEGATVESALKETVRLAQYAERWGYSRFWVSEHHDMAKVASVAPEVLLAHIGAKTDTIRLGSGALLLPHYKPMKVAEAFRQLAALYPGRIDLGVGRAPGGSAHASMALSDHFLAQVGRMPQLLGDLTRFLEDSYELEGVPVIARPQPKCPMELWLLGTNVKSAKFAAEFGTGYTFGQFMSGEDPGPIVDEYRRTFQPSMLFPKPRVMLAVSVVCAASEAEARELALEGARAVFGAQAVEQSGQGGGGAVSRPVICGTRKQVAERLLELQRLYEADGLLIVTTTNSYEQRLESYRALAEAMTGEMI